jgi:hypothetical protein
MIDESDILELHAEDMKRVCQCDPPTEFDESDILTDDPLF